MYSYHADIPIFRFAHTATLVSRDFCKNIRHPDPCETSDRRQEQICLQDLAIVCISKRNYLGFGGSWFCPMSDLVFYYGHLESRDRDKPNVF